MFVKEKPTIPQAFTVRAVGACLQPLLGMFAYKAVYLWCTNGEAIDMSNNITYTIRIDSRIRKKADELYKSMGLSLSAAVNLFLTQSVIQRRFPIDDIIAEPLGEPPPMMNTIPFTLGNRLKLMLCRTGTHVAVYGQ